MISKSKIAIVQVARRQLQLCDDDYRAILAGFAGVQTASDLDDEGFHAVMARFEALGFRSTSTAKPLPARRARATPAQISLIRHLWHEFTGGQGTDTSLGRWLEGRFKLSSIHFVDDRTAPKVIAALRNMTLRKAGTQVAHGRG
ncbi:MAG TPA: regulatory protein GemA [Tistrella mobilis]|uniref:Regulatory protein GemA n=1 Tax=Tistrella mobilis TaxID=171437 RepID=A0A3B9IPV3_9PROT|nr:regulatory protein GemA [Tistrella mobilis]